jgi:hypothetical protein
MEDLLLVFIFELACIPVYYYVLNKTFYNYSLYTLSAIPCLHFFSSVIYYKEQSFQINILTFLLYIASHLNIFSELLTSSY